MVIYLLVCCDTRWTTKLLRLSLYLKHMALSRATVTVTPTVLTAVHGEVVSRPKLREAGITAKFMYHILVINFMSNLESKTNKPTTSGDHQKLFPKTNIRLFLPRKWKRQLTTAFFWHILHLVEMLFVFMVTIGFFFSSYVDKHDWLQKSLLVVVFSNWALITSFGFKISLKMITMTK